MHNSKLKGAESFVYVLAAGLGLFILIAFISTSIEFSFFSSSSYEDKGYMLNDGTIKEVVSKGEIYYFDKFIYTAFGNIRENTKRIYVGEVDVGSTLSYRQVKKERGFVVENGIFGKSSKEFVFEVNNPRKVRISFEVNRTNRYGKLRIYLNDVLVFDNFTRNGERILIEVENNLKDRNILRFESQSSLPRLWAPTKYEILDLSVEVLDYIGSQGYIEFELMPDEYEGLRYVELKFNVLDSNLYAPLNIISNGVEVFSDVFTPSAQPHSIWLYRKDNLRAGVNVLKLTTEDNAYYNLRNVEVVVHYLGNAKVLSNENNFVITEDEYSFIDKNRDLLEGVIEIRTNSINLDKGIVFYVNGGRYEIKGLRKYDSNYVVFDIDLLKEGSNVIRWETTGSYDIEYIKIGVRRK